VLKIEILTTGDEVLEGLITDTNSAHIAREVAPFGVVVRRVTAVGDTLEELRDALLEISARADVCVMTGGLGPTSDDLTLDALALAAGVPLAVDEGLWEEIQRIYLGRGRVPPSNRAQARVPRGGVALRSAVGTAPGMRLTLNGCEVFAYPGVPEELYWHCEQTLLPYLAARLNVALHRRTLRVCLLGESRLYDLLRPLSLPPEVRVGYQALHVEVRLKLSSPSRDALERAEALIADALNREAPGHLISHHDRSLPQALVALLTARDLTAGCAESCTGGAVSAALAGVPGASAALRGGVVAYSNDVKRALLGVRDETLAAHGAVSEACALEMARGARAALGVDWALAVTGVAGPGGGTPEKPVGTVWFAWAGPHGAEAERRALKGDRERIQRVAAHEALFGLWRRLSAGGAPREVTDA